MKSILLHVGDDAHFSSRLDAALDLARYLDGHLECLQTRRIPAYLGNDSVSFAGSATMLVQLMEDEAGKAEAERAELTQRLSNQGVSFSFSEAIGEPAQTLVDRSLLADVIVMTLPNDKDSDLQQTLASVVTHADAPVLAIPPHAKPIDFTKPALVAWKATKEAGHAVKRARPLLKKIGKADILAVNAGSDQDFPPMAIASYLARQGVEAVVHERSSGAQSTSDILLATARELDNSLIVMGGYGRSRAMEFLLGGVTRRLLATSDIPLLLAH